LQVDVGLEQRVLLVTGSTQGIGLAIAELAAKSGARAVFVTGRDRAKGEAAVASLKTLGVEADFLAADLADENAPDRIFSACLDRFGAVELLVNAAALTDRGSVVAGSPALWDSMFAVNARAPFFLMQRFIKHRRERKAPGSAVNILSMNVHGGTTALAVYAASKAALALLTKNAAHSHRFDRIRINGINVGWTDTPAERQMQSVTLGQGEGWLAEAEARAPFGRLLKVDDVARLATFLLSDASSPMTGALVDQEQSVMGPRDQ
jgi:NAD(P)-dependent dehydrogenase (short-subunit alcohol dehydrogenase family)